MMEPVLVFRLILVLLAAAVLLALAARRLRIPPSAAYVMGGMALALVPGAPHLALNPGLILALFLPPLLQSSAFFTVWRDFRANLRPILLLSIGCVAFTTLIVAVVLKLLVPVLPWAACFALGAIISPPDAVSAASVLEHLRIPRRLRTIIEGESLVNDASGLVLYRFAVAAALTGTFSPLPAAATFVYVAVAGLGDRVRLRARELVAVPPAARSEPRDRRQLPAGLDELHGGRGGGGVRRPLDGGLRADGGVVSARGDDLRHPRQGARDLVRRGVRARSPGVRPDRPVAERGIGAPRRGWRAGADPTGAAHHGGHDPGAFRLGVPRHLPAPAALAAGCGRAIPPRRRGSCW